MEEKSHVSLEQRLCLVCGLGFDTGVILLERRLRQSMKRHTLTSWGLCDAHRKLFEDGFVALIECDPQRSAVPADQDHTMRPEQAVAYGAAPFSLSLFFLCLGCVARRQAQRCDPCPSQRDMLPCHLPGLTVCACCGESADPVGRVGRANFRH